MTGFIRGLFSKLKSNEAATPPPVERPKPEKVERPKQEKSAFFLESSDAQTYGNLDYMKASKKIRRTFPKTLDSPENKEYIQELSAMGRVVPGQVKVEIVAPKSESEPTQTTPTEDAAAQRRKASSDMDMFRKMAKDIRK
ncbi:MAG: hypothetical protein KME10_10370 [Plectolyngbya sp. WJT66-NPBG17]|jgi:hypothetical protein|nr:hypothetical protein [Plectolyngbya sp. WJT66-NPBG17]MBW4524877.1 hypothetical protein [Phormidium tanganyikae FI6-MK23]